MSSDASTGDDDLLLSEPNWKFRLGDDWTGTQRFTGTYSNGMVFQRSAADPPGTLDMIVVKQRDATGEIEYKTELDDRFEHDGTLDNSNPGLTGVAETNVANIDIGFSIGLRQEAEVYELMNRAKSLHIPRMYRRLHTDVSQGTQALGDYKGQVERIYLEYCPGRTLRDFRGSLKQPLEEEDDWWLFHNLALACAVMDRGTEDPEEPAWDHEIVHFDIDAGNILFGSYENESDRLPTLKFNDFNCGIDVKKYPENDPLDRVRKLEYRYYLGSDYTFAIGPPETSHNYEELQKNGELTNVRLGSAVNIWQVGLLMYDILLDTKTTSSSPQFSEHSSEDGNSDDSKPEGKERMHRRYSKFEEERERRKLAERTARKEQIEINNAPQATNTEGPSGKKLTKWAVHLRWSEKLNSLGRYDYDYEDLYYKSAVDAAWSTDLRALVLECLLPEPHDRPSALDLQNRTRAGLDRWKGTATQSFANFPQFKNCPRRPKPEIPPPEWKEMDDSAIDLVFKIFRAPGQNPWEFEVRDLPMSMNVKLLKRTLLKCSVGIPFVLKIKQAPKPWWVKVRAMSFWWGGRELADEETLGDIGIAAMDVVACFKKHDPEPDWSVEKKRLRDIEQMVDSARHPKRARLREE